MTEKAYAKINVTLEVLGKKGNFHDLESFIVPINIYDTLTFSLSDEDQVVCNIDIKDNNILKAIKLFKETYQINDHVKVDLNKQIPIGAGLGGSSADISATLRGLNRLFNLNKPLKDLEPLANQLGSDTLFCLYNKRAFIYGRGDHIHFYDSDDKLSFLIIMPTVSLLTKDVFQTYQLYKDKQTYIGFEPFLKENDMDFIIKNAKNDLLQPALHLSQPLNKMYDKLKNEGLHVHMSGAGSSLFIINPTNQEIKRVKNMCENTLIEFSQEI